MVPDRVLSLAFLLLLAGPARSQSRNDHWFLMRDVWLDFSSGSPLNQTGLATQPGYAASLASPSGELLLYTPGDTIYNALQDPVIGTDEDVLADGAQGALLLPWPDDPSKVAVFAVKGSGSGQGAYTFFFDVDLTMNGGAGGTNYPQAIDFMEPPALPGGKMTGIPHANGTDYWVLVHERDTDGYHAYHLDTSGLDTVPVISNTGSVHGPNYDRGCMVASYDGSMVVTTAYVANDTSLVDLLEFNDATGEVNALCSLPGLQFAQGVEFSPGGSKLYVTDQFWTGFSIMQQLWQYDLSSLDCAAIRNSRTLLRQDSSLYGNISALKVLAQGPDGKIYYRHFWKHNYLGVVNDPDESGVACNYVQDGYLTLNDTLLSITNQCKRYHDSEMPWTLGLPEVPGPERAQVWPVPMRTEGWLRLAPGHVFDALLWTDATGRTVRRTTTTPVNGLALGPEGLAPGVYTVRALLKGAVVGVGTVVKE